MITDNLEYNDNNEKTEYFKKVLSENIKKYRTETQEVAAEKAELSVDMFSLAERGKSLLNSYNLTQVANALNVTPNHLVRDFIKNKQMLYDDLISYELDTLTAEEKEFILYTIKFIKQNKLGK